MTPRLFHGRVFHLSCPLLCNRRRPRRTAAYGACRTPPHAAPSDIRLTALSAEMWSAETPAKSVSGTVCSPLILLFSSERGSDGLGGPLTDEST